MKYFLLTLVFFSRFVEGSYLQQEQKSSLPKTTLAYLKEAHSNLIQTEELGIESLNSLATQRETLKLIQGKMGQVDSSLNYCDSILTEMENPWTLSPRKKQSRFAIENNEILEPKYVENPGLIRDGVMYKRREVLKNEWSRRFFELVDNRLVYYMKEGAKKEKGYIELSNCSEIKRVSFKNRPYCLEIIISLPKVKSIFIQVATKSDYDSWYDFLRLCIGQNSSWHRLYRNSYTYESCPLRSAVWKIQRKLRERSLEKVPGQALSLEEDNILDEILDSLCFLDRTARAMGDEVDDQRKIIREMNKGMETLDGRVIEANWRTKRIR